MDYQSVGLEGLFQCTAAHLMQAQHSYIAIWMTIQM